MLFETPSARRFAGLAVLLASFTFQAFGRDNNPDSQNIHTQDVDGAAAAFVAERLSVWQERMAMKDWHIQVTLVKPEQLEPQTLGDVHWDTDQKSATISVLSPESYKLTGKAMLDDMEVTVVHELVHIELASLPRSDSSRRIEEHAVVSIARALLKMAPPRQQDPEL